MLIFVADITTQLVCDCTGKANFELYHFILFHSYAPWFAKSTNYSGFHSTTSCNKIIQNLYIWLVTIKESPKFDLWLCHLLCSWDILLNMPPCLPKNTNFSGFQWKQTSVWLIKFTTCSNTCNIYATHSLHS